MRREARDEAKRRYHKEQQLQDEHEQNHEAERDARRARRAAAQQERSNELVKKVEEDEQETGYQQRSKDKVTYARRLSAFDDFSRSQSSAERARQSRRVSENFPSRKDYYGRSKRPADDSRYDDDNISPRRQDPRQEDLQRRDSHRESRRSSKQEGEATTQDAEATSSRTKGRDKTSAWISAISAEQDVEMPSLAETIVDVPPSSSSSSRKKSEYMYGRGKDPRRDEYSYDRNDYDGNEEKYNNDDNDDDDGKRGKRYDNYGYDYDDSGRSPRSAGDRRPQMKNNGGRRVSWLQKVGLQRID